MCSSQQQQPASILTDQNFFPFYANIDISVWLSGYGMVLLTKPLKSKQLFSHLSPYVLLWTTNKEKWFHCISFPFVAQILWVDDCVCKREKNGLRCETVLIKCGASLEGWWCNFFSNTFYILNWVRCLLFWFLLFRFWFHYWE